MQEHMIKNLINKNDLHPLMQPIFVVVKVKSTGNQLNIVVH